MVRKQRKEMKDKYGGLATLATKGSMACKHLWTRDAAEGADCGRTKAGTLLPRRVGRYWGTFER